MPTCKIIVGKMLGQDQDALWEFENFNFQTVW
jgi:hypothetical protein